ncbi:hypothetical protein [Vallitalea okinawensis]|uniref:hypothetical protein n=1 Tax=Vallitalea okinawensis TaxID=2078660 RepID=UPI000CFADD11|nr:hypothetical protein [Vallitalea okinawensis]
MEVSYIKNILTQPDIDQDTFEEAIKELNNYQFQNYHIVALLDLIMHYIATEETFTEQNLHEMLTNEAELNDIYQNMKHCVRNIGPIVNDQAEKVIYTDQLKKAKRTLEDRVKVLVAYNDTIELFESILKKKINKIDECPDDEALAGELLNFAFMDQDKFLINQRIKEILRIVPIRMAKEKTYDYVRNSMQIYYGGYQTDLQNYLKGVKDTILPERVNGYGDYFNSYTSILHKLSSIPFNEITEDEACEYLSKLEELSKRLEQGLDICRSITELVNLLIVIFIGPPFDCQRISVKEPAMKHFCRIMQHVTENDDLSDSLVYDSLTALEGIPEKWHEEIDKMDGVVDLVLNNQRLIENLSIKEYLSDLVISKRLLSTSLFAEIDQIDTLDETQTDRKALEMSIDDLNHFIEDILVTSEKEVGRGKINQLLYTLPIAFRRPQELFDFILVALQSCSRLEEKLYTWREYQVIKAEYM